MKPSMKPSTKYGMLAVASLGVVSLVHQARSAHLDGPQIYHYVLGVLPNVAAAVALPFAFMSVWCGQNPVGTYPATRRWFFAASIVSAVGLVVWEFLQPIRGRIYDPHDIGATIVGLGLAGLVFHASTPDRRPA
ncbi:hypothetical protein [Agrilutibacter solisilvae]|uniref:Uncharacterized protein n=1 Tax=Agrilutibacter solisilvae TaxID=2763317 RepID=A0A974Y6E5_9GAMM|nr:hypothetical protein [Lysobacter solisilvae]QSX79576.1 hypothetical protein I8J32_006920 [Lysobacter solisilvae]